MIRRFLSRLTDVTDRVPVSGDLLAWSATPNRWVNTAALAIYGTQTANTVLAGPTSGGAANPTFRALVVADVAPVIATCFISGDVSNSLNPAAWADVTAFSFPVASGATYAFEFYCQTTTAATTTRASYGVNGPTFSLLVVNVSQFGGATGNTAQGNSATAYDTMNNIQTTSGGSTTLPTTITGLITTTASGTLILRQKSNVNSSAVTVKAGSWGRLTRIA